MHDRDIYNEGRRDGERDRYYGIDPDQWNRDNRQSGQDRHSSRGDDRFGDRSHNRNDKRDHTLEDQGGYHLYSSVAPQNENTHTRKRRQRALNFEEYAQEGYRFINEVAREIGCNRDTAARISRAVLHAVRDRIPADDAVQFAQGLPMALKGVFFDQYDISNTPVLIRNVAGFLEYIRCKDTNMAFFDFPYPEDVAIGLRAVFRVLERNMDHGQVQQIKNILPFDIHDLIDGRR